MKKCHGRAHASSGATGGICFLEKIQQKKPVCKYVGWVGNCPRLKGLHCYDYGFIRQKTMDKRTTTSLALVASTTALTLCGLIGGWFILLSDGFHHQPSRFSRESVFVSGLPALVMAAIFFLMAAIGIASLIQRKRAGWGWYAVGCSCVLLPPVWFVLLYW